MSTLKPDTAISQTANAVNHRASLPVPNSTHSFWFTSTNSSPSPAEGSSGPLTEEADVCIIGSGITGVSAAYHLAKILSSQHIKELGNRVLNVTILEARDFCSGATGRNGGHLTETRHFFSEFHRVEQQQGVDEALRAKALESHNVEGIINLIREHNLEDQVDLVQGGLLTLYITDEEYRTTWEQYQEAKKAGVKMTGIEWLAKEETLARFGAPYPAMLSPGNNLWPYKLVALLYNLAKDVGSSENSRTKLSFSIHTNTPVTAIDRITDSVNPGLRPLTPRYTLSTPRGSITCSYILHATNAYVSHLLPHMGGPDGVIPTRGQVVATRAGAAFDVLTTIAGAANEDYEYWFPRPVGKNPGEPPDSADKPLIIFGGGREVTLPGGEFYITDDSKLNPDVSKFLREFLPRTFPGKYEVGVEPEMEWSGIMGFTKSTDPFVGPVVDPSNPAGDSLFSGQYVSAGYTGHGMPRAFACAEAIAQMIAADMDGVQWRVPDWLPRSYLTKQFE